MSIERPEKSVNTKSTESVDSKSVTSRRRFITSMAVPAALAVVSKPVFATGNVCNISGFTSVNPSGVERHETMGCGGFSPGAWKNPYSGRGDGSLQDWITAGKNFHQFYGTSGFENGFFPNPDGSSSSTAATKFSDIFSSSSGMSLHDAMLLTGSHVERFAACAFLSACFFKWGTGANKSKISPVDIIGLYDARNDFNYVTTSGTTIDMNTFDLKGFYEQLQH